MPVEIIDVLAPKNSGDFPTHDAETGKGGWRSVADMAGRNAIPAGRRSAGMRVRTNDDGREWLLDSDLTTWIEVVTGRQDIIDIVGNVVELFVDPSGNDDNDGFSYGTAFLTLQAAVDAIPENLYVTYDKRVLIHVGAGTYDKFLVPQRGVYIRVIGDRRTPLATWPVFDVSFALVSGYAVRHSADISGYLDGGNWSGTVDETTHWLETDFSDFGDPSDVGAVAILDSVSPELNICDENTVDLSVGLHPFVSQIDCPDGWSLLVQKSSTVELIGLYVTCSQPMQTDRVSIYGCRIYITIGVLTLENGSFSAVMDSSSNNNGGLWLVDSTAFGTVILRRALRALSGVNNVYSATIKGATTTEAIECESRLDLRNLDFETQRRGIVTRLQGFCDMRFGEVIIQGSPTVRFITVQDGATVRMSSLGTHITGSVAGVPVQIQQGTVLDCKSMCDGFLTNSTTPGSEVTVGGNATVAFSALPTTDLALGNTSTLSRAT